MVLLFIGLLAKPTSLDATVVRLTFSPTPRRLLHHFYRHDPWDQGKELALHRQITATTGTAVFFCDAHSPWQRGSNENTNGLLRDYFPKGTDLSGFDAEELQRVAVE